MPAIPTTDGDVEVTALGRTMGHEHLRGGSEGVRFQWPHAFDPATELAYINSWVEKLGGFGVETIVDPSCMDLYRDVHLNLAVTRATGVRFVMCTGVYGVGITFLPLFLQREPEVLVDYFVHDIEVGIQGTEVRAGFLKCAADAPGMTKDITKIHECVAEASLRTNTPIMAHSNPRTGAAGGGGVGLEQIALFKAKGVDPSMIQIAHVGDTDDLDYIERLLEQGVFIGMDRYGLPYIGREERQATVLALLERGYADRMVLGQDCVIQFDGLRPEVRQAERPDSYPTFLFEEIVPELLERGATQPQIDAMLGSTVGAWLTPLS